MPDPDTDPERYRRAVEAWDFPHADDHKEDVRNYFEEIADYQFDFRKVFEESKCAPVALRSSDFSTPRMTV